jgi:hypothetical protein
MSTNLKIMQLLGKYLHLVPGRDDTVLFIMSQKLFCTHINAFTCFPAAAISTTGTTVADNDLPLASPFLGRFTKPPSGISSATAPATFSPLPTACAFGLPSAALLIGGVIRLGVVRLSADAVRFDGVLAFTVVFLSAACDRVAGEPSRLAGGAALLGGSLGFGGILTFYCYLKHGKYF